MKAKLATSSGETARTTPDVRHAFSPRNPVTLSFEGPGRTKQSFRDECDINRIMARYQATGTLDFVNRREAQFLDVSDVDFQNAMQIVIQSREAFMLLPSDVRERFANDPAKLLGFLQDESNYEEAVKLGLVNKRLDTVQPGQSADKVPGAAGAAGTAAAQ